MRVLAYDLFPNDEWAKQAEVEYVEILTELLRPSDVVSLHTPLTPETSYTIRAETIELMNVAVYSSTRAAGIGVHQGFELKR
jgi:D-lactate dehydrogenase